MKGHSSINIRDDLREITKCACVSLCRWVQVYKETHFKIFNS